MPATNKVGTQLLVSPHIRARGQALAIVRHEAVAEVWRAALEGAGLAAMESAHAGALERLRNALDHMGVGQEEALNYMTRNKMIYTDLTLPNGEVRARFPGKLA